MSYDTPLSRDYISKQFNHTRNKSKSKRMSVKKLLYMEYNFPIVIKF